MTTPMETILALTAATLIGVGSLVVILPKTTIEDAAKHEVKIQCESQDEGGKCLEVMKLTPEEIEEKMLTQKERMERIEKAVENIREKLDRLEKQTADPQKK